MSLRPGSRVGPYEIVALVGVGGMGEVFRARDTRLDRTVAVKTISREAEGDPQLLLRLRREAKAISALAHPHICALYDVGEVNGIDYLVMEFLEGETLADRIEKGPLPLDAVLRYAIEIAGALDAAHRGGVIHRDLKPTNIMLTRAGAKLLDFGLARTIAVGSSPARHAASERLTEQGMVVGTPQHMAPEQLHGMPSDARTDIFAFGTVLYEMLTGRPAFDGISRASLIASILTGTPEPVAVVRPEAPLQLQHVLQRCLEKDPEARWQSAHDLRLELQWIATRSESVEQVSRSSRRRLTLPWAAAALASLIAAAAIFFVAQSPAPAPAATVRARLLPPVGHELAPALAGSLSISPDGRYVTYNLNDDARLWVQDMTTGSARPIEGTQNGTLPFWSPDSRNIAFFTNETLSRVSLTGASPVVLCRVESGRRGSWNDDGVILFTQNALGALYRVSERGGKPEPVTKLDAAAKETTHRWGVFLPDGNHFLYAAATHASGPDSERMSIYVSSLDAPSERTFLLYASSQIDYANDTLIYEDKGRLLGQRFDVRTLKLSGDPFAIADNVEVDRSFMGAAFELAENGTLVYHTALMPEASRVVWVDDHGRQTEVMRPNLNIAEIKLSHDDRSAIASDGSRGRLRPRDLYLLDLERGIPIRLTFTQDYFYWSPVWSPDSKRVVFTRGAPPFDKNVAMVVKNVGGNREETVLLDRAGILPFASDWSRDGTTILYVNQLSRTSTVENDIWRIDAHPGAEPKPFITSKGEQCCAAFSPDGKWVVYTSDESGRNEVYAIRYPDGSGKTQLSLDGALAARWASDRELIVYTLNHVYLVPVTTDGDTLRASAPVAMSSPDDAITGDSRDGKRFLYVIAGDTPYLRSIALVTNVHPPNTER